MQHAGIDVRAGIDLDPACEYPYSANIRESRFLLKDVSKLQADEASGFYRKTSLKLLAGCAPCKPFSTLRNGRDREKSDKWPLLNEFGRLVKAILPDFVTMENVPALNFENFIRVLSEADYYIMAKVVDAADYGVPQRRKRLVLLASRKGPIRLMSPEELGCKRLTVADAIANLRPLNAGEMDSMDPTT